MIKYANDFNGNDWNISELRKRILQISDSILNMEQEAYYICNHKIIASKEFAGTNGDFNNYIIKDIYSVGDKKKLWNMYADKLRSKYIMEKYIPKR